VDLVHNKQSVSRTFALALYGFGREAVEMLADRHGISYSHFVQCAVEHHLERDVPRRPGTSPPPLQGEPGGDDLEVVVALPAEDWEALELESGLEGVPLERLLEHAVLALIADLDSGRVAVRIAARLG
jgi:hypothetical protein